MVAPVTTNPLNPYYDPFRHDGEEISSTGEGRHIQVLGGDVGAFPIHPDGGIHKGDPIALFDAVGVALNTILSPTEILTVDTEGIWRLPVTNTGTNNFVNIIPGQVLFISGAGIIMDTWVGSYAIFGFALQPITGVGTMTIAVKVHWMYPYWFYDPQV